MKKTGTVLGNGSISYEDLGVKVPYEMNRNPEKNGGQDTLYTRQRKVFAPFGISYEKKSQATLSPTNEELKKTTVPRLGAIMAGHKSCGMEGTFSGTAHYNQSVLRQALLICHHITVLRYRLHTYSYIPQ